MSEEFLFELQENILKKMLKKKEEMGYADKSWNEWFEYFLNDSKPESTKEKLERIFEKITLEKYYDEWIRNFSMNLNNIQNDHSARELIPQTNSNSLSSALVIGRGPSIKKHNHLEILSKSNYKGTILCSDGSLADVLKAGITPEKFKNFFVMTIDTQE